MTIQDLKDKDLIIFEAITGSTAYGTAEEGSDIDKKGVFILPLEMYFKDEYIDQVSDEKNDNTYYEIGKFIELLSKGNPTAIELLFSPDDVITHKKEIFDILLKNKEIFITKVLRDTFGKYAEMQIKKARGLNKKIVNPMPKEKKTPIDFCYVIDGYNSYPLQIFLDKNGYNQKFCGIVNVPNAEGIFSLYYDEFSHACFDERISEEDRKNSQQHFQNSLKGYKGIIKETEEGEYISNTIRYSSIPKADNCKCVFFYNKNGYSVFCKEHKEHWEWVSKRNPVRYNTNMNHGKKYDSKNMSHCHRLLDICIEIGEGKGFNVKRPNREQLLLIKHGEYEYDNIIAEADEKISKINQLFNNNDLPENVRIDVCKQLLYEIRFKYYML